MVKAFVLRGTLRGHTDTVTAIATPSDNNDIIVTSSKDNSLIVWRITREDPDSYGVLHRRLIGHSDCVNDVALSSDAEFAVSASSDGQIRVWDLATGATTRHLTGHSDEVLSVALRNDERVILSGSRDRTIKMWDMRGTCMWTVNPEGVDGHTDWVSCVRFSPAAEVPFAVSGSWDGSVRVWDVVGGTVRKRCKMTGQDGGYVKMVAVAPDGSLAVSGGEDGTVVLWEIEDGNGKEIYELKVGCVVHGLCLCPTRYWLCVATLERVIVFDVDRKIPVMVFGINQITSHNNNQYMYCTTMNWTADGTTFFCGYTDGLIRIWEVMID